MSPMVIAIDFDGTITKPGCGNLFIFRSGCKESILELERLGFELILWTCRYDESLQQALDFLEANGILKCFSGINQNSRQISDTYNSRKIVADIYIDDRNIGGLSSWYEILKDIKKNYCPMTISKSKFISGGIISETIFEENIKPLLEENGFVITD